jgi:hypothetical protein
MEVHRTVRWIRRKWQSPTKVHRSPSEKRWECKVLPFAQTILYRSDNCFTIVEGINPGAEVLPPILMKGPSPNVGTPVEQIVLANSNHLPENGLFEIRDTRTGRRIHPSELPFTLTFTPYSPRSPNTTVQLQPLNSKPLQKPNSTTKGRESTRSQTTFSMRVAVLLSTVLRNCPSMRMRTWIF